MTDAAASAHMSTMESITAPDVNTRLASAQDPATESQVLWQLIDDPNDLVANTARERLRLALRPIHPVHAVHIPVIDPATGLVVQ